MVDVPLIPIENRQRHRQQRAHRVELLNVISFRNDLHAEVRIRLSQLAPQFVASVLNARLGRSQLRAAVQQPSILLIKVEFRNLAIQRAVQFGDRQFRAARDVRQLLPRRTVSRLRISQADSKRLGLNACLQHIDLRRLLSRFQSFGRCQPLLGQFQKPLVQSHRLLRRQRFDEPHPQVVEHSRLLSLLLPTDSLNFPRLNVATLFELLGRDNFLAEENSRRARLPTLIRVCPHIADLRIRIQ